MTLNDGSTYTTTGSSYAGYFPSGNGTVSVSAGSWTNTGDLTIGLYGTGSLTINGTGNVTNTSVVFVI